MTYSWTREAELLNFQIVETTPPLTYYYNITSDVSELYCKRRKHILNVSSIQVPRGLWFYHVYCLFNCALHTFERRCLTRIIDKRSKNNNFMIRKMFSVFCIFEVFVFFLFHFKYFYWWLIIIGTWFYILSTYHIFLFSYNIKI